MSDIKRHKSEQAKGGLGTFLLGGVMALAGGYLLTNQVQVSTGFWGHRWSLFGSVSVSAFGMTVLLLMFGLGFIFYDSRSVAGWLLSAGSLLLIFVGIIANLEVYFATTSLYTTLIMLGLLAGGIGLMLRALRAYDDVLDDE
ncbi:MAG TPA: hypothetical protein VLL52_01230 [Anaerolineae bacterium]|nr:hypothetical protein [Anaerolineae bacterium]